MSVERLKNMKRQVMACMNMIRDLQRDLEREIGEQNRYFSAPIVNAATGEYIDEEAVLQTAEQAIGHLNQCTGRCFDPSADNTLYLVRNLLEQGYTAQHMIMAIDYMAEEWLEKPKMQLFLRPQTLLGENFESYLQYAMGQRAKSRFMQIIAEIGGEG